MHRFPLALWAVCILIQTAAATVPTISSVTSAPVDDMWAQIKWTTNQNATSIVEYGLTTSYGSTAGDSNSVMSHRVTLYGLTPLTTYHYRVKSTNSTSETGTSGDATFTTVDSVYGCESNPTGEPLGGGAGYSRIVSTAGATVVSTSAAFRSALSSATSGTIIYVDDAAQIDLSGYNNLSIPGGVTIASGRGRNGSVGGLIYTTTFTSDVSTPLFRATGANARMTGVRLAGPHNSTGRTEPMYHGVYAASYGLEIDNCEVWGFNYAAVETTPGTEGLNVHHCYFHHNTRTGVGYAVCPSEGVALIEGNMFDYHRHSIASSGKPGSSYEARYNLIMEHSVSHLMDMHGANDFESSIQEGNWRFDESSGSTAYDTSEYGYNSATLTNFSSPACWVTGKINHGLQFDGVDDYVNCGADSNLATSAFSIVAWIKPTAVTGTQAIVSKAATGYGFSLRLVGSTLEGTVYNSSGAKYTTTGGTIGAGAWTHVALTFNGSTIRIFVNGAQVNYTSCSGVRHSSSYSYLIGRDSAAATSYFTGIIDEVRAYSDDISAADVLRHYNLQGDIAGDLIRIHHNTTRSTDQSSVIVRGIPTVGGWVNNNWFLKTSSYAYQTNATGNFTVANNLLGSVSLDGPPDPALGSPLGQWSFSEGSGSTTTADGSGNGYTGTLTNMDTATCWVTGHTGGGLHFDGVNDFVDCGAGPAQTDNFAIDLWVKFDELADNQVIVTNGCFDIINRGVSASHEPFFRIRTNEGVSGGDSWWAGYSAVRATTSLTAGAWYHIVAARSGNKMQIYINGVLERELEAMASRTVNETARTNLKLGTNPFKGTLDEVNIFVPAGSNPPTLAWTGEANFTSSGVYPQTGTMSNQYNFRVKYIDPANNPPKLGYPKLHILRNGVEFTYFTPMTMMPVDNTTPFSTGRIYQSTLKLPRGSDYTYYFEAYDSIGDTATGAPTSSVSGPTITSGNSTPVLYYAQNSSSYVENPVSPSSGTSNTSFDYRCVYLDIDNDPPAAGYPKLKITDSSSVEIPGSPFTMSAMTTAEYANGRHYQLIKKLPAGSYKCQILANDSQGTSAVSIPMSLYNYPTVSSYAGTPWTEIFTGASNPNPSMSFQVAVSFAQSVTGFDASDVTVTNGSVSGFSGSGAFYVFTVTATAEGTVTVSVPPSVVSPANNASSTISRVCYPSSGADNIYVGYGYTSNQLGTYADPFNLLATGLSWVKSGGTIHILTGANPETLRITKAVRLESVGGTATIGRE